MARHHDRRNCQCCRMLFFPDPRAAHRQRYCSKPECRRASKAASQKRWSRKNGNGDYFRGPDQVARVQRWRRDHPGYWKSKKAQKSMGQVPDNQSPEPFQSSCNAPPSPLPPLQDQCLSQNPVIVGLISMITGYALQEQIAATTQRLFLHGREILGNSAPDSSQAHPHDSQTSPAARPAASGSSNL